MRGAPALNRLTPVRGRFRVGIFAGVAVAQNRGAVVECISLGRVRGGSGDVPDNHVVVKSPVDFDHPAAGSYGVRVP